MAHLHLKADYIRDLPLAARGQDFYFDTQVPGFGVRVGIRKKAYFAEGRVGAKKRRVTLGSTDKITINDGRKLAKIKIAEMAGGTDHNKVKAEERAAIMTLREALDLYLCDQELKPSTAKENRRLIERDLTNWLDQGIKSLTPSMCVARFDKLTQRSPAVANHVFWVLRAVLNYARVATKTDAGEFTLPANPCDRLTDLTRWHKPNARTGRLLENQFPGFFEALKELDPNFADYMELLVRAGLRRTEAASLNWVDVNMTAKTFTIIAENSKTGNPLTLPMSTQIEALFYRRRDAAPKAQHVFGDAKRYDPRKSLSKLREAIGSDLTYHDCRRTFLNVAEEQAVPYGLLKKMGNHSAGNDVTLKHYANTVEHETLRPYMQRVSDQIDRLAGISNRTLKISDQIDHLQAACDALSKFQEFSFEVSGLQAIVDDISRRMNRKKENC